MSAITVRLFHHPTRTPIAELQGVDPGATLSSLRAMAERHLASEEACMMRVFARWHIEVAAAGRRRVVELTAQDEASSLSSLGIEDYSEVLLEGPLTGDFEGVGQAVSIVAAQVREQHTQLLSVLTRIADSFTRLESNTSSMRAGISELIVAQRRSDFLSSLPYIEHDARLVLAAEERRAFGLLPLQEAVETGRMVVVGEEAKAWSRLQAATRSDYQRILPHFTVDTTTTPRDVDLKNPFTAVKTTDSGVFTLRSSQPLSAAYHRWAVKIHECGSHVYIMLGLLPKLSADLKVKLGSNHIRDLGGWCIDQNGNDSYVLGDWDCEPLSFAKGDLVLFDYSFRDKTLTICCGDRQVVGHIPKPKGELYPAFTLGWKGEKVSFEKYPL